MPLFRSLLLTLCCFGPLSAQWTVAAEPKLAITWEKNFLTIRGDHLPGKEMQVMYLEAYCRPGSTDREWGETVIGHVTEQISNKDNRVIELVDTLRDGVIVKHVITAKDDEIDFQLVAHNPTGKASQAHWAQPCIRVDKFTGAGKEDAGALVPKYARQCFVFLDGKLTRLPTEPWADKARYVPGQVYCPRGVDRNDVNPRPLSKLVPSSGLCGCFSADDKQIMAVAWEPYQEIFQGVAGCMHSDFRLGGLKPGETKKIRGKMYFVENDVKRLVARYERDFPEQVLDKPAATPGPTCMLTLELLDAATSRALPGNVSIKSAKGERVTVRELVPRGLGVGEEFAIHDWHVLPAVTRVAVPQEVLTVRALHGLETEFGEATVDLRGKTEERLSIPLTRFYNAHAKGWQSANTHVHLMKTSREEANHYLLDVARAERLDIVYISYLERAEADLEYTTNKFSLDDLRRLTKESQAHGGRPHKHGADDEHEHSLEALVVGTEFDNGQEHRHNFAGFDEGYGHVMFLHLPELIQPVSIGPGIMKRGTDDPALRPGIDKARSFGSAVIWCHNQWGLEDIPNWLSGKLQANNIFDGGAHGSFKHSFYRYLNAGLRVPFSTGTDWFIYDFSRVYVAADQGLAGGGKRLSSEAWLAHLAAGRSYITNGPLLEFTVADRRLGDTLDLPKPGRVKVSGRAVGRLDFERIELVRNGEVVKTVASRESEGHFAADLDVQLAIDEPCWLALRTPPPSAPRDAEFQKKTPLNEYGRELFAHTSAVYVNLAGRGVFQVAAAESLLEEMKASRETIRKQAQFAGDAERDGVLRVYDEGIKQMQARIVAAKK